MDIILLGITIVSLLVALVMSVTAWRVTRDEKKRSAARVAALALAANANDKPEGLSPHESRALRQESGALPDELRAARQESLSSSQELPSWDSPAADPLPAPDTFASPVKPVTKAPWAPARASIASPAELPLNQSRAESVRHAEPTLSHASGFLGAAEIERDNGGRQKTLAFAALFLFVVLSGGLVWSMSESRSAGSPAAVESTSPLELVSLSHERQNDKLAVSGLVRNPASGQPIQQLSAVVFLFDRAGTFVTSSRAKVDFLKLGAGDESPFVVSLDAPATVSRYRVSFRTDDGVVPHVDRRQDPVVTVNSEAVKQ